MKAGSSLVALSLLGASCAAGGGGHGLAGAPKGAAAKAPKRRGGSAPAPTLVSEARLGPLAIRKWRLPNGLEAILVPDAHATSVTYMTWYRVGSRHEDAAAGETGLAHLFEHLMFTQTKGAREEGEFDRKMEEVGGNANAMTYYDFTAYVDNLPPDGLTLAVALESDRMANLALRDEQVVTERKVVAEERLGSVDDSVEGLLDEKMWGQAFGAHPYRFPVIGLMKDIKAVTPAKAARFYKTYYAPNNAVVVIAGRFDADAALALLGDHYGDLAPSTLPADRAAPERGPAAEVRAEVSRPVPADKLVVGFPAPALADADRAAYELVDQILAGGPSSRLHRRLVVDRELASSVDGTIAATKHPGLYSLWVQMTRKHRAEQAEAIIDEELARLAEGRVTAAELARAKARLETAFWQGLTSSEGKAEQLGEFDVVAGDYRVLLRRADEYAAVTADDVRRVARTYFAGRARSVVIARPGGAAGDQEGS